MSDDELLFYRAIEKEREAEAMVRAQRASTLGRSAQPMAEERVFRESIPRESLTQVPDVVNEVNITTECRNWEPRVEAGNLTVLPGAINDLVPSNIFDAFAVPASGTRYLIATCSTDGSQINAITLSLSSSAPTPAAATSGSAPLSFDVLITVVNDAVPYKIVGCSPVYAPREVLRVDKAAPTPGTLPYTSYYTWTAVS